MDDKWNVCLAVDQSITDPSELSVYFSPVPNTSSMPYKIILVEAKGVMKTVDIKNYTVDGKQCLVSHFHLRLIKCFTKT